MKKTIVLSTCLLLLSGVIGASLALTKPSSSNPKQVLTGKIWKEYYSESYTKPILAKASEFSDLDQESGGKVEPGTPKDALKYEVRLNSNCAIDQSKFILSHFSRFIEASASATQKQQQKDVLSKIAAYPKLKDDMNDFEVLNKHNALQSQMKLSLNSKMLADINNKCAARVYYKQQEQV